MSSLSRPFFPVLLLFLCSLASFVRSYSLYAAAASDTPLAGLEPGTQLHYAYSTSAHLADPAAHLNLTLRADVRASVAWEMLPQASLWALRADFGLAPGLGSPFYVLFGNGGGVERLWFDKDDDEEAKNVKRGIASLFQVRKRI